MQALKFSTPAAPKAPEPRSILLLGPPGGGKSALAMQFPKVCFLDCDRNLDGPEKFVRSKVKDLAYAYIPVTYNEDGTAVPVDDCFDRLLLRIAELKGNADIDTVCVDGITMINEFIVRKVLKTQGGKSVMEPHFWGPFKSYMMQLLVQGLRSLAKTTIVTCHEVILEKPNSDKQNMMNPQVIGYRPAVQGGITDYFGGYFTDVWRCVAEPAAANRQRFVVQVVRDTKSDLKNSLNLPNEGFNWLDGELGYPKIEPYLKGLK